MPVMLTTIRYWMAAGLLLALMLLAACSRHVSPPLDALPVPDDFQELRKEDVGARESPSSIGSNLAREAASFAREGVTFSVDPGSVETCEGSPPIRALVKWDVRLPLVSTVNVEVDDESSSARKLFAQGGVHGEARTDAWVTAGVGFHLLDGRTGEVLALRRIATRPCD